MIANYVYVSAPSRIVFGEGVVATLSDEVKRLGCNRPLLLSTPAQAASAESLLTHLGEMCVGIFPDATMHTPISVTERAVRIYEESKADCVVAFGGGSTTGLAKAIAWRNDAKQIIVPTTYAGSEVTPILGQTENGRKETIRDAKILPETVVYDPAFTLGLPVEMSVNSGLNAIAHAVEALYARDKNPVSSLMAVEGVRAFKEALPKIAVRPNNYGARSAALYGSWLCGTVLGAVGMSLHHKLCHTLGGLFDLPHAETHAILIPHTAAYNGVAAEDELQPLTELFGGCLGGGLYDFAKSFDITMALRDLGLEEKDLDKAAEVATQNPYWNPREIDFKSIRNLLQNAWEGSRPGTILPQSGLAAIS
ncbi:MAG: maleylacetate reductase [Brucella sp.]